MIKLDEFKQWAEYAKDLKLRRVKTEDFEMEFDDRAYIKPIEEKQFTLPEEQKREEEKQNEEILFWSA